MYLNQFESSVQARLKQILTTLESVHGITIKMDLDSPAAEQNLLECQTSYETQRDNIIKESAFNSYQQNPEYVKSILIIEAVNLMLTEIAPKRRRARKIAESNMDITDYIQDAVIAAGSPGTDYYRVQDALKMLGSKMPAFNVSPEARKHISNAWQMFNKLSTDAVGRDFLGVNSELSKAKDASLAGNSNFSKSAESIAEIEEVPEGALKDAGKWLKKSGREFWNGTPEELDREKREKQAYADHVKKTNQSGEVDEATSTSPEQAAKNLKLGQAMIKYSTDTHSKDDNELALLNAFSNVGDKLVHMGTPFGPAGLTDVEQKVARLAALKLKALGMYNPDSVETTQLAESIGHAHHYEYQASMARSELYRNTKYAMSLMKQVDPHGHVKPWVGAELAKSAKYLDKIFHYLEYKSTFEPATIQTEMDGDAELDATSGDHIRHLLTEIAEYSIKLFELIKPTDRLEGWVAMKLTTASEGVSSCKHYMDYVQFETHALDNHFMEGRRMIRKHIAESLLVEQDQEELAKAQTILAAKDMSSKLQGMAEDVAKMAVEDLMPLVDVMRSQFGPQSADGFNQSAKAALETLLNTTTQTKEQFDGAVDTLSTGGVPQQPTDIANAPAMPGADTTVPADGGDMAGDLASLAADGSDTGGMEDPIGSEEDPLGRAKKPPMAEGKTKEDRWKDWKSKDLKSAKDKLEKKKKKSVTEQRMIKSLAAAILRKSGWNVVSEGTTPAQKAAKFIKENKAAFEKKYGESGLNQLYATAWKKFAPKSDTFNFVINTLTEAKIELNRLNIEFDKHAASYKKSVTEGKSIDPLNLGYGLEGNVIINKIGTVSKVVTEAKALIKKQMTSGISEMIDAITAEASVDKLAETKSKTPYGVIYTNDKGKKGKKMFESIETRSYWLGLRSDSIKNISLIGPETFDRAMRNIS